MDAYFCPHCEEDDMVIRNIGMLPHHDVITVSRECRSCGCEWDEDFVSNDIAVTYTPEAH